MRTSSLSLVIAALCLLVPSWAAAQEACGVLPADPSRIELASQPDEERALDLYDKAYQAFSADDCHCTAWYNLKVYELQPTPVLMQNIAAALERCGDLDAARRYARHTLTLTPDERERTDADALIARLDQTLAGANFSTVSLANDYQADAMFIGHVSYRAGDAPTLAHGSHVVSVDRGERRGINETIQVPPVVAAAGCTADTDCQPGQRCELATGACLAATGDDLGGGVDALLISGIATGSAGVLLLVTSLALDLTVSPKRDDYDAMHACLSDPACGEQRGSASEYAALGDEIDTLVTAEIGTLIAGGVLTAVGTGLLLAALLADDGGDAAADSGAAAPLVWGVSPLYGSGGALDGAWLDLALRF